MPPPARFVPDAVAPKANKPFVDRSGQQELFRETVRQLSEESQSFLVFYGFGGQGKTRLCERFLKLLADEPMGESIRAGLVNLAGLREARRAPAYASLWVRNCLARQGVRMPAYDLAFAVYWSQAFAESPLPNMDHAFFARTENIGAELMAEGGGIAVKETLVAITEGAIESVPFAGAALRRLSTWTMRKLKPEILKRMNGTLKLAWPAGEPPENVVEQERLLPWFLAQELYAWQKDHPGTRYVVLVDEYEAAFPQGLAGERRLAEPFDAAMRELAAQIKGILWVYFSRERLPWADVDPAWAADMETAHNELRGLERTDAEAFLGHVPVEPAGLREAMVEAARDEAGARCYPFLLELQVDHYWEMRQRGETPTAAMFRLTEPDFAGRRNEIIRRLLRDYSPALEATLKRLAVARRLNRDVFVHLVRQFVTGFPLDQWAGLSRLSFMREEEDGLVMQSKIREALITFLDEGALRETHEALFEHFVARSACTNVHEASLDKLEALTEAFHHKSALDPAAALLWLRLNDSGEDNEAPSPIDPFRDAGLWGGLKPLLAAAADIASEPLDQATILHVRGQAADGLGNLVEAEALKRQALDIRQATLPEGHALIAQSLNNLGMTLQAKGDLDDAETLFRQSLDLWRAVRPEGHPDIATSLNNLAETLRVKGDLDGAEALFREALDNFRAALPEGHTHISHGLNNLGEIHRAKGDLDSAEALNSQALDLRRAALPEGHPDIAQSLNNLGETLRAKDALDGAETLHRQALDLRRAALPEGHPHIATSLNNLAATLHAKGDVDGAETLFREALDILHAAHPAGHPRIAQSLNNLAFVLLKRAAQWRQQGRYVQAKRLRQQAEALWREARGDQPSQGGAGGWTAPQQTIGDNGWSAS